MVTAWNKSRLCLAQLPCLNDASSSVKTWTAMAGGDGEDSIQDKRLAWSPPEINLCPPGASASAMTERHSSNEIFH